MSRDLILGVSLPVPGDFPGSDDPMVVSSAWRLVREATGTSEVVAFSDLEHPHAGDYPLVVIDQVDGHARPYSCLIPSRMRLFWVAVGLRSLELGLIRSLTVQDADVGLSVPDITVLRGMILRSPVSKGVLVTVTSRRHLLLLDGCRAELEPGGIGEPPPMIITGAAYGGGFRCKPVLVVKMHQEGFDWCDPRQLRRKYPVEAELVAWEWLRPHVPPGHPTPAGNGEWSGEGAPLRTVVRALHAACDALALAGDFKDVEHHWIDPDAGLGDVLARVVWLIVFSVLDGRRTLTVRASGQSWYSVAAELSASGLVNHYEVQEYTVRYPAYSSLRYQRDFSDKPPNCVRVVEPPPRTKYKRVKLSACWCGREPQILRQQGSITVWCQHGKGEYKTLAKPLRVYGDNTKEASLKWNSLISLTRESPGAMSEYVDEWILDAALHGSKLRRVARYLRVRVASGFPPHWKMPRICWGDLERPEHLGGGSVRSYMYGNVFPLDECIRLDALEADRLQAAGEPVPLPLRYALTFPT